MELTLRAETGRPMGSRPARRLRREGMVPATVYGREREPVSISVNARDLHSVLHTEAGVNALITLDIGGDDNVLTMAKEIQRHPFRSEYNHVDFLAISLTEKVTADVLIQLEGEPVGVRLNGGIIETLRNSVEIEALPQGIPSAISLDIADLDIGDTLKISDLPALEGVEYLDDLDSPVVTVVIPAAVIAEEEVEEDLEEGEEGEEVDEDAEAEESSDE
ncbi:MAG: 50S ribosomal protein L25 [Acidimicrobiia bacterium]|jgi:large subunit ribosomal protein L25|nr:50S ribosomal protein L25 [Acidimicrobiia bacterium]